jgi:hypothetical protein
VIKSNRGQLSIFMGITLIIVMSMLAFIINVGLFVKAKINLQNATDAAAFSGAATQARQLTNIAYANWELRNTYKEWMFKYYVLGQLGLVPYNFKNVPLKGKVNFLLDTPDIGGEKDFDKYNIPSICIHNNSKTNICPIYSLPGIPQFDAIGVAGIAEIHAAFVAKLGEEKGKDCSRRSNANFLTALTWAYGSGLQEMPEAPLVATNRPGAWPQALELAFRIRNLEMIMNRPPVADISLQNIGQFRGQAEEIGLNERPIKAFWSAYRNLGGGAYKNNNTGSGAVDELSYNLSVTELAPQPFHADTYPVSQFLIPKNFHYSNGTNALEKHYVDLQLMPVNLATMFSTFVTTSIHNVGMDNVRMDATCGISKSAMPVPGYIMGFTKNPEVLTYYAVKAESKFIGLFFPISTSSGIKLTAYAAAKPFGGRIGPKLFSFRPGDQSVIARGDNIPDKNNRSGSYVNGLKVEIGAAAKFTPGMPIPSDLNFWTHDQVTAVGGIPGNGGKVSFAIPNMIYDFVDESDLSVQQGSSEKIHIITPIAINPKLSHVAPVETLGLYHAPQFKALKDSLGPLSASMTGEQVMNAIIRARRATKYDAINYLVPDFREVSDHNNAAPIIQKLNNVSGAGFKYKLFAPLLGPNLLYKNDTEMGDTVNEYLIKNQDAVEVYLKALRKVADGILAAEGNNLGAAQSIHDNAGTANPSPFPAMLKAGAPASDPDCKHDMASKFNYFFNTKTTVTACDIVPLQKLMVDYIDAQSTTEAGVDKNLFYIGLYYNFNEPTIIPELKPEQLMTAYFPGARQGTSAGDKGIVEHPLKLSAAGSESYSARRNFYSTKFFHMAKVLDTVPGAAGASTKGFIDYQDQPALKEMATEAPADLVNNIQLKNPLKYSEVGNNIYYLDF